MVPHAIVLDGQGSERRIFHLIECISASGSALTPELHPHAEDWVDLSAQLAPGDWYESGKIGQGRSEGMSAILYDWLVEFERQTRSLINQEEWRQLIPGAEEWDLISGAFIDFASSHRIDLCNLLPGDTHLDHALDKNILPSIQVAFAAEIVAAARKGKEVDRLSFLPHLKSAREKIYKSQEVVTEAFRSSGLFPLNGDAYRNEQADALVAHLDNLDAQPRKYLCLNSCIPDESDIMFFPSASRLRREADARRAAAARNMSSDEDSDDESDSDVEFVHQDTEDELLLPTTQASLPHAAASAFSSQAFGAHPPSHSARPPLQPSSHTNTSQAPPHWFDTIDEPSRPQYFAFGAGSSAQGENGTRLAQGKGKQGRPLAAREGSFQAYAPPADIERFFWPPPSSYTHQ